MRNLHFKFAISALSLFSLTLCSCASNYVRQDYAYSCCSSESYYSVDYTSRIPHRIATNEKVVVVDPNVHTWGAYDANGNLENAGLATAGGDYCPDLHRPCHTHVGVFRISSLGSASCKSHIFPLGKGGAPMQYCMFFSGGQALHGSDEVVEGNVSHGCVRLRVSDAAWLRYNFVDVGTKVVVKAY